MSNRVKDIEFQSANHVIEEIRNMNVKGGSPLEDQQLGHLNLLYNQEEIKDIL